MSTKPDTPFEVGQTVYYYDSSRRTPGPPEEVPVTRVGRKYVYVKRYGREAQFTLQGIEVTQYGAHDRIMTAEMVAEEDRRKVAVERLKAHDITHTGYRGFTHPTDTLEKVADLLDSLLDKQEREELRT